MQQLFKFATVSILLLSFISCSSSIQSVTGDNFKIEYYSGGGFTGIQSGLTIFSDGTVKLWKQNLQSSRQITDSLKLSDEQFLELNETIIDSEFFSYHYKFSGNYATYLTVTKGIQSNQISFNGSDLPPDMPASIKDLISEIKTIYTK
jgi:hypothetical protein